MNEDFLSKLMQIRAVYKEVAPTDQHTIEHYAWTVCKAINKNHDDLDSLTCRQLLADVMQAPLVHPSALYTYTLEAALKMAAQFPDFHFVPFLRMWNIQNLSEADYKQKQGADGKVYPSLAERVTKAALVAQLIHPNEVAEGIEPQRFRYHPIVPMIVVKVSQTEAKGRKLFFATLSTADGMEIMAETHTLRTNPLIPSEARHYVNVGELYNVLLRDKQDGSGTRVVDAVLSTQAITDVFPAVTGYVEHIDQQHAHIHIYDNLSRHFVSAGQRSVRVQEGQFVQFVPITPQKSKFKSAIIIKPATIDSFPPREIRITWYNAEKQYYAWELIDNSSPITEQLSSLQISHGDTSPSFTQGFVNADFAQGAVPDIAVGNCLKAIVFLRRGKDGQKRPCIARLIKP